MFRKTFALFSLMFASTLFAAEPVRQFRTPFHLQDDKLALWAVVPDWNVQKPKALLVLGRLWKDVDKGSGVTRWTEVMGGGLANRKGGVDPVLNVRIARVSAKSDFYGEAFYNAAAHRTTLVFTAQAVLKQHLRAGVEFEPGFGKGKPDFGIGPKITIPWKCGPAKCAFAATYFVNKRIGAKTSDVLRGYAPVTLVR